MKAKPVSLALLALTCVALTGLGGCVTVKREEPSSTTTSTTTRSVSTPVGDTAVQRTTTTY